MGRYHYKIKKNIIRLKDENGNIKVSNTDNANILNSFFESVYTTEDDSAELILNEASELLWEEPSTDPFDYKGPTSQIPLMDFTITEDMVIEELKKKSF